MEPSNSQAFVKKQMTEPLFIAYANHPLRDDPNNLFKIYDAFDQYHPFIVHLKHLRVVVEIIVATIQFGKPKIRANEDVNILAQEAVYGYSDGFCETKCRFRDLREEKWGRRPFEGPSRWNCMECDQCDYTRILWEIVDGLPYSEIKGLSEFIKDAPRLSKSEFGANAVEIEIDPNPTSWKLMDQIPKIETFVPFRLQDPLSLIDEVSKSPFRVFWRALVAYTLSQFIDEDEGNRDRLKLCPGCNSFFKAEKLDRIYCYFKDCKNNREKRRLREFMRQKRDPNSLKYDERYKTREFGKKETS